MSNEVTLEQVISPMVPVQPIVVQPRNGFSLVEMLIVIALIMTVSALVVPMLAESLAQSKETSAVNDLEWIAGMLLAFEVEYGRLPDSLEELFAPQAVPTDPWGNEYQYLKIRGGSAPPGKRRKDRFLVPISSDFDLYSMGPDGQSAAPLTAASSRDDIIRANDGAYYGPADEF